MSLSVNPRGEPQSALSMYTNRQSRQSWHGRLVDIVLDTLPDTYLLILIGIVVLPFFKTLSLALFTIVAGTFIGTLAVKIGRDYNSSILWPLTNRAERFRDQYPQVQKITLVAIVVLSLFLKVIPLILAASLGLFNGLLVVADQTRVEMERAEMESA